MDIATIAAQVATKLADADARATALITAAKQYIEDFQTTTEMQFTPAINPSTTSEFRPQEQQGEKAPAPDDSPAAPELPIVPPNLVTTDSTVADHVDISAASNFSDPPAPSGDSPSINIDEPATAAIADAFIALVKSGIKNSYSESIRSGVASRSALAQTVISRVQARLAYLGLGTNVSDMQTLADYQMRDSDRLMSAKGSEVAVDNDIATVQAALSLAGTLYQNADAVYNRALDVAKTMLDVGNSIYQMRIGVERSAIGVAKTAQQADFEVADAQQSTNRLNLRVRQENVRSFQEVSDMAIQSLGNITSEYEAKVAKYGVGIDRTAALVNFDLAKGRLSEQALSERVDIAIRNAINALDAFAIVSNAKNQAIPTGEGVYSEAINGVMQARSTLIQIGKKDQTTTTG